jgi:hypothetical protein
MHARLLGTGTSTWTSPDESTYTRLGFWPVPTRLGDAAVLPPPRLEAPLTVNGGEQYDHELPVWHEPLPPRSRHGWGQDLHDIPDPEPAKPGRLATDINRIMARIATTGTTSSSTNSSTNGDWDNGPPPF